MSRLKSVQSGVVSLLTVILISILLIILTTGMAILMVGEQRQATDADLSIRAFFGAESGVERAVQYVRDNINGTLDQVRKCQDIPSDLWDCLTISTNSTDLLGSLNKDESAQLDLTGGYGGYNTCGSGQTCAWHSVRLNWNDETATPPDPAVSPGYMGPNPNVLPPSVAWTFPAAMEVSVISYPIPSITRPLDPNSIKVWTVLALPVGTAGGETVSLNNNYNAPVSAYCQSFTDFNVTGRFNCQLNINDFNPVFLDPAGRQYILRFRPRYAKTTYKVGFFQNNGATGNTRVLPDQNATIDVTAGSGDVYRNIISKIRIRSGAASGLDYVLFADKDICKDFKVTLNTAVSDNPLCPLPGP